MSDDLIFSFIKVEIRKRQPITIYMQELTYKFCLPNIFYAIFAWKLIFLPNHFHKMIVYMELTNSK